jgi:hypothetical protein
MNAKKKPRLRGARGVYAIFSDDDGYGNKTFARVPVQFWREKENGSWAGLVADSDGLRDAHDCSNFVRFQSTQGTVVR